MQQRGHITCLNCCIQQTDSKFEGEHLEKKSKESRTSEFSELKKIYIYIFLEIKSQYLSFHEMLWS